MTTHAPASQPDDARYVARFSSFVTEQTSWFKRRADAARNAHNALRVLIIVLSACLPALTTNELTALASFSAVAIAVLTGLDAHFKPGQQWRHYRSTQLGLARLQSVFDYAVEVDSGAETDAFRAFHSGVTRLLETEEDEFWTFRVTMQRDETEKEKRQES